MASLQGVVQGDFEGRGVPQDEALGSRVMNTLTESSRCTCSTNYKSFQLQ